MPIVSVIIPARNEIFLQKTVSDILTKAKGEIEVIVILDGYWPTPPLIDDERLKIIHRGTPLGMRAAINAGVAIAKGKFLLKCDAHCMFAEGFDTVLVADCKENWVMVPRRFALDADKWQITDNPKYPIDYMYLTNDLHGEVWNEKNKDEKLKEKEIDDIMSSQGSCWFMPKDYFNFLDLEDEENYGTFSNEFQEVGLKCWLSGGRVVVNKKTWYAHLHKTKGRGYSLGNGQFEKGQEYSKRWLTNTAWHKQTLPFNWLVEKFKPVPTWSEDKKLVTTLDVIIKKYKLDLNRPSPIEIPGVGRDNLAELFAELGFTKGVEVGTEKGLYAEVLCKANPALTLTCVDPWISYPELSEFKTQESNNSAYLEAQNRLSPLNCKLIKAFSMDAVKDFPDNSLDFVYIDANHSYNYVYQDITEWSKKVRPGGIVAGHDYFQPAGRSYIKNDTVKALNDFTRENNIHPLILLGAKWPKTKEEIRDKIRSWMWVKTAADTVPSGTRVYIENFIQDAAILRVSNALKKYLPPGFTLVNTKEEADFVVVNTCGPRRPIKYYIDRLLRDNKKYAIIQHSIRATNNPGTESWLPIWEKAGLVWSHYDLFALCKEDGTIPNFNFYRAPLGVDNEIFKETEAPRRFIIAGTGNGRPWNKECKNQILEAADGKQVFQLGLGENTGNIIYSNGMDDITLAKYYSQCQYVSGLRRIEGFELPTIEGLLCGARPICFDTPGYRYWFNDIAEFIPEDSNIIDNLRILFAKGARPVSEKEKDYVRDRFNWEKISKEFWRRFIIE